MLLKKKYTKCINLILNIKCPVLIRIIFENTCICDVICENMSYGEIISVILEQDNRCFHTFVVVFMVNSA